MSRRSRRAPAARRPSPLPARGALRAGSRSRTVRLWWRAIVTLIAAFGLSAGTASAASVLYAGQSLTPNTWLTSPNGKYKLYEQTDGNLVLYDVSGASWTPKWATYVYGGGLKAVMQSDGNFVVYDGTTPKWSSGTAGFSGSSAFLQLQDDGNLVIYRDGLAVWNPGGYLGDTLSTGQTMKVGAIRRSRNGRYQLQMQTDGNLVLYDTSNWSPTWASYAFGSGLRAVMQTDGNLVVYDGANVAKWNAQTPGFSGADLRVQDDGNLVIVHKNLPIWAKGSFLGGTLTANQTLNAGDIRRSANGRWQLQMQTDGNLVLYDTSTSPWSPRWATYTVGSGLRAQMQSDGHFVIYDAANNPKWYTGTNGHPGARIEVQNNGHLVVMEGGTALWVDNRTSWQYGGDDGAVNTSGEKDAVINALRVRNDADALSLFNGLSWPDQGAVRDRAYAASSTSVTYGGSNWKVDTDAELAAWATRQQQLDDAGQDWLFSSLATDAERQFVVAQGQAGLEAGTATVTSEGPIEVPTAADTASLDDAADAELARRAGLDGTTTRGCKRVTYSLQFKGRLGVVYGRAYHEARYCWNKRLHRAGGGDINRAWFTARAAGQAARCTDSVFNHTVFKESWDGYAKAAINMQVDIKVSCLAGFKTTSWRLGIRGRWNAISSDSSYKL